MKNLKKQITALFVTLTLMLSVLPLTALGADNAVSVTFGGSTAYYATIDAAWEAAIALETTAENKATIKLLANCTAENTLTNTADYLVLDTNGKTLTTPNAIYTQNDVTSGIRVEGGSLELIGNGTITGISRSDYNRAIVLITGGKVYANGITIHNTGTNGSNPVRIANGEFCLLDGHLITDDEYALYINGGKVSLYSGTLETGRAGRMVMITQSGADIQICYSDRPLYLINNFKNNWSLISDASNVRLEDNLVMDLEYSDNPDGSDSTILRNVTEITDIANTEKNYLKIQTYKPSYLYNTSFEDGFLDRIRSNGVTEIAADAFTAVHFVDLADYDLTNVTYSDYSASGDGSVKAWMDGTELYIGGSGKIIAGKSLANAFRGGLNINSITGLDMLDTARVTDMGYMFYNCGKDSSVFTLDLGDKFDTSKVTRMTYMFCMCGANSTTFALNLGDKFDTSNVTSMNMMFYYCGNSSTTFTLNLEDKFYTSNVTDMYRMFEQCGYRSTAFTTLDLSTFTISANTRLDRFAVDIPVNTFVFGKGWRNAVLPVKYNRLATSSSNIPTEIIGATKNLLSYDWAADKRPATFTDNVSYTITALTDGHGWVSEGGTVLDGESITLTATADYDYTFDGWYDGDTKVCDTEEFVIEDAADDKTYTAKFTKNIVYYTITAEVGENGGGTVSGGGTAAEGGSITLTATANDGYTFDGWYDGDTKVCDTADFVVENVSADKTYTAKFTKDQIIEPDPEPENPDIPYLKWDGSTLTLVKKETAICKVGIVYVGGATFDADNINWDELIAVGKEYANLNSSVGYAVYNNFTKRTPGTRGNYVAFVKYTKDDGTTTADYITYTVKNAVSFEIPALSYNTKTKTLKMKGNVSSTIGVAYIGDEEINAGNITWNDFIKAGKKYPDINGGSGYAKILDTLDYTKTFDTNGNYAAFIKYFDENLNKTIAKYYTFTVADYDSQPTDAPFAVAEENKIILTANGFNVTKVTIVYIGTDDMYITNWNEFAAAAAKFPDINGKTLNRQYANPKDGSAWGQDTAGWYAVYIRYIKDGKTCNSYYTVELN